MNETKLTKDALYVPSIVFESGTLSSSSEGKVTWNGEEFKFGGGRIVGDQWISMDGTIPVGGLAFLGQTVSKTTYYELYNWIETHNRFKTEAEWQSLYTSNNGNVSFYAKVDDNTFRLPSFKGYLKANETAGGYTKEGLPNITGLLTYISADASNIQSTDYPCLGAFRWANPTYNSRAVFETNSNSSRDVTFDASLSNSIYGNSTHVTPETNTILIGVYAITSVNNTSGYDLQEIINIVESTREGAEELISTAEQSFNESLESINNQINTISNNLGFIGEIKFSSYDGVPSGYLICDGSAVSRTTYSALFNVIGTKWGTGDGSTTFTLPNLIDKVAWGATSAGTYKSAGLPNITGTGHADYNGSNGGTKNVAGAFYNASQSTQVYHWPNGWYGASTLMMDASRSNAIYGKSTTVQPPAATVVPVIKYI